MTELEGQAYAVWEIWEGRYVCVCVQHEREHAASGAFSLEYWKPGLILRCATYENVYKIREDWGQIKRRKWNIFYSLFYCPFPPNDALQDRKLASMVMFKIF